MKNVDSNNIKLLNQFTNIQIELLSDVTLENSFDISEIQTIAGVDLAYWDVNKTTYGTCCIVMIDYNTKEVVEKVYSYGEINLFESCL